MTFEEFQQRVAAVPCAGGREHGPILYGLVRWLRPAMVVEAGTCRGFSAAWLGRGLQDNGGGRLVCIDDWSLNGGDRCDALWNLASLHLDGVTVELLSGRSDEVRWPGEVDLAYVDGDHSEQACSGDVERAIESGARCVVVHDTASWWGPRRWVERFRAERGEEWDLLEVVFGSGLAIAVKREEKPKRVQFSEADFPAGRKVL